MNNKRQTIWLVSMLSLMVILSAYYLFTEDVTPNNASLGTEQTDLIGADKASTTTDGAEDIQVSEVDQTTGEVTAAEPEGISSAEASDESAVATDTEKPAEEVLKDMNNLTGSKKLDEIQLQRMDNVSREAERLAGIMSDTKNRTQDEAKAAGEELMRLEDMDNRIESLQMKLLQEYDNAVVSEEQSNYKVIVLSDKMERKDAVSIVDLATKELNVTPDRVIVQYVQ